MAPHLRIARPVGSLERSVSLYQKGLGLDEIGRFENHDGFDGVMLGKPGQTWHFEFTYRRAHPVAPAPTPEDLIVLYLPDADAWRQACAAMLDAGFAEVPSFNPYWGQRGRTFEDPDRYRVVLQREEWAVHASASSAQRQP